MVMSDCASKAEHTVLCELQQEQRSEHKEQTHLSRDGDEVLVHGRSDCVLADAGLVERAARAGVRHLAGGALGTEVKAGEERRDAVERARVEAEVERVANVPVDAADSWS